MDAITLVAWIVTDLARVPAIVWIVIGGAAVLWLIRALVGALAHGYPDNSTRSYRQ